MNKIIFLTSILAIWLLSGFYSFELIKGGTVVGSVQVWEFYKVSSETFKFVMIHIFLSMIIGSIVGLSLSFLIKGKDIKETENKTHS